MCVFVWSGVAVAVSLSVQFPVVSEFMVNGRTWKTKRGVEILEVVP